MGAARAAGDGPVRDDAQALETGDPQDPLPSEDLSPSDPPYQDPFAARARMKSYPVRGPIRRRIWDLEEPDAEDEEAMQPERRAGGPRIVSRVRPASREPDDDGFLMEPEMPSASQRLLTRRLSDPAAKLASASGPKGGAGAKGAALSKAPPDDDVAEARAQLARATGQSVAGAAAGPAAGAAQGTPAAASPSARTKTRILGFQGRELAAHDPFAQAAEEENDTPPSMGPDFPVGWIVVADGPGRGASFTLQAGVSSIGRGEDQVVRLDFGDTSISRQNHASIAYDDEAERFFLGHGGKSNLVRLNDRPVLSTEDLDDGDVIRIGETSLKFVALCKDGFTWGDASEEDDPVPEQTQRRSTMRVDTRPGLSGEEAELAPAPEAPPAVLGTGGAQEGRPTSRQVSRSTLKPVSGAPGPGTTGAALSKDTRPDTATDLPSQRGPGDATAL